MTQKEILHTLLNGMDPYISCGVPTIYWELARTLTLEIYGQEGVELLESTHETCDTSVEVGREIILHSISQWTNGGDFEILPPELIAQLEELKRD